MIGFHIDMNMAQYRVDYLKRWLARLAHAGYDTVVWEVENSVEWDTCPECAAPDAISKSEFRDLIAECRRLGLEPIPLFQTIGHAEYVLKHPRYAHLRELPDKLDQYCPRHPDLIPFLHRWIEEYLDVFGPVKYFHLGADEAWWIGQCPRCQGYSEEHSISDLYIEHISQAAQPLLDRGITPIIWADMLLHYPQALNRLSRDFMLFDWVYWVYRGSGTVQAWGKGTLTGEDVRALEASEWMDRFGAYLFPHGDEPGQRPETFYTADYLAAQGFKVVTCPAASSYGDNVFSPRNWLHLSNTFDSFKKGMQPHLHGTVLTSWSVHLFPWELQWPSIAVPAFLKNHPTASLNKYPGWFERYHFRTGETTPEPTHSFWKAAGLLSKSCLFSHTSDLGFGKEGLPVPADHVEKTLALLAESGKLEASAEQCRRRLAEYEAGLRMFESFSLWISHDSAELADWKLAALNLVHRAKTSLFLIEHAPDVIDNRALTSEKDRRAARQLLESMNSLRNITQGVYDTSIRPQRSCLMVEYMFGALERTLATLAG